MHYCNFVICESTAVSIISCYYYCYMILSVTVPLLTMLLSIMINFCAILAVAVIGIPYMIIATHYVIINNDHSLQLMARFCAILAVAVIGIPYMIIAVVILLVICLSMRAYYIQTARDIKRFGGTWN